METQVFLRQLAYALLAGGCLLAFLSAVVPHYDTGHRLMVSVLLAGLLPYLVFALALPYLRGWLLAVPVLLVVSAHAWLVITERFVNPARYSDGVIYAVPTALALVAAAVVAWALNRHPCGSAD